MSMMYNQRTLTSRQP